MNQSNDKIMDEIKDEINSYIDESLNSSRRIMGLTYITKEVGANILEDLGDHSDKLNNINEKSNKINNNLKITNSKINRMKFGFFRFFGFFGCMRKNIIKHNIQLEDTETETETEIKTEINDKNFSSRFVKNIIGDIREEEINLNLKEADSIIKDIKSQSIIIGKEIDKQNKLIENITNNIENNSVNIKNISNNMKEL